MIKTKLGENDPSAAIVAAMLEIGDAHNDMTDRTEAAAERVIEGMDRSAAILQIGLAQAVKELNAKAERRHHQLARRGLVVAVVATVVILWAIVTENGRSVSIEPSMSHGRTQGELR